MNDSFCKKIDKEFLIEKYVAGQLSGPLLKKFEKHITICKKHSKAVALEKLIKKGVTDYVRSEMKLRLGRRVRKSIDTRSIILKFAAILFIATITPLIIYYQLNIDQSKKIEGKKLTVEKIPETEGTVPVSEKYNRTIIEQDEYDKAEEIDKKTLKRAEPEESIIQDEEIESALMKTSDLEKSEQKRTIPPDKDLDLIIGKSIQEQELNDNLLGGGKSEMDVPPPSSDQPLPSSETQIRDKETQLEAVTSTSAARDKETRERRFPLMQDAQRKGGVVTLSTDHPLAKTKTSLSESEIMQQLSEHDPEINDCFNQNKELFKGDTIQFQVELVILPNGSVEKVKIIDSDIDIDQIYNCIINKIKSWKFKPQVNRMKVQKKYFYKKQEENAEQLEPENNN